MAELYRKGLDETEKGLMEAMENMDTIDAHEHNPPEEVRTSMETDIFTLFCHYTKNDLLRSGMSFEDVNKLFDTGIPLEQRWDMFEPHWQNTRHTSYSRAVLITVKKIFGEDDINKSNYREISEKIKSTNKPGLYKKIFKDTCKIKICLNQNGRTDLDPEIYLPVMPLLGGIEGDLKSNREINDIESYIETIENNILKVKKEGAVGLKMRTMPYAEPDRMKAEEEFKEIKKGEQKSTLFFGNYALDRAIAFAGKQDMTIAVHTGYWGDFRKLHPLHMIPLLQKYPDIRFDIYHLGYPWIRDAIMLGKGFSNVWLNLCWAYIISQKASEEALDELIDTVPSNKIIGFGGDYNKPVETIYGHLVMARECISKVLGKRIREKTMTEKHALGIINQWLFENPARLYKLDF